MTIRRRLLIAAVGSSLLVASTIGGGIWTLRRTEHRLDEVRRTRIGAIDAGSELSQGIARLCAGLGELIQAKDASDAEMVAEVNGELEIAFADTRAAVTALGSAVEPNGTERAFIGQDTTDDAAEISSFAKMAAETRALEDGWQGIRHASPGEAMSEKAATLDARADALMNAAIDFQHLATTTMMNDLRSVSDSIGFVRRVAALLGAAIVMLAALNGLFITRWLVRRLSAVRARAQQIGAGDLSGRIDVLGNDEIDAVAIAFNDMVVALRKSREQLEHDALHDALTGLPNRPLFIERVGQRILEAKRSGDYRFVVLFIDLDHFKLVNDSLGHAAGDELLRTLSARLVKLVDDLDREHGSRNTVARLGGDEFTMLIERCTPDRGQGSRFAEDLAKQVQAAVNAPITLAGQELLMTASIGVTVGAIDYDDPAALLRDADAALYRAKGEGRARHAVFDLGMHETVVRRLRLENDLRRAVERNEMLLHYQPVTDLENGELIGFEALIRWNRDGKLIPPDQFIPIAEQTGQIIPLGEWVIERACQQLRDWRAQSGSPRMVSVNVSPRQLTDANLVPHIRRVLTDKGLEPSSLIVEITETALVEKGLPMETLAAIRALGVRVYIDDFGTGYSTLSGLNMYPVDGLKIDRSFVKKNEGRRDQMAVLRAVVELAHNLSMPVIAEGVETPEQLAMLQGLGCDRAQGFLFSRPVSAEQAEVLIRQAKLPALKSA